MSFDDNILLKIRREFSGKEKYRLFLQQLDRLETELKRERELNTDLLKKNLELKEQKKLIHELQVENNRLKAELGEYTATEMGKKFVRIKAYEKLQKSHQMWETRFWELHKKLNEIESSHNSADESL
jgi:hypothetical protein